MPKETYPRETPVHMPERIQWSWCLGLLAALFLFLGSLAIHAPSIMSRRPVIAERWVQPSTGFPRSSPDGGADRVSPMIHTGNVLPSGIQAETGSAYLGRESLRSALGGSLKATILAAGTPSLDSKPSAEGVTEIAEHVAEAAVAASTEIKPGEPQAPLQGAANVSLSSPSADLLILITPTYPRAFQELHLTRLVSTIRQIGPPLLWLVVESPFKTNETALFLERTAGLCLPLDHSRCRKVDYVHLETGKAETAKVNRGVVHRNCALDYIQDRRLNGIMYFMDDDNTYMPQLFEEIRGIKRAGMFPVGILYTEEFTETRHRWPGNPQVERPLVRISSASGSSQEKVSQIYGWETAEWCLPRNGTKVREYNVDMAGFAFRSDLLWLPSGDNGYPKSPLRFTPTGKGLLENGFLLKLARNGTDFEALADDCTDVFVWHLHVEADKTSKYPSGWFIDQPRALVPIKEDINSTWPFVVDGKRHGIQGRGVHGKRFVYS